MTLYTPHGKYVRVPLVIEYAKKIHPPTCRGDLSSEALAKEEAFGDPSSVVPLSLLSPAATSCDVSRSGTQESIGGRRMEDGRRIPQIPNFKS
jgi:hypothetical protein